MTVISGAVWYIAADGATLHIGTESPPPDATHSGGLDVTAGYSSASNIPWYGFRDAITTAIVDQGCPPKNINFWFYGMSALTDCDIAGLQTDNVTSMFSTFNGCSKLTNLNVSNWNTSNVTTMRSMFYGCSSLTELDVSHWRTSSVTDLGWVFYKCYKLKRADVSGWDTSNVTRMKSAFCDAYSLRELEPVPFRHVSGRRPLPGHA